MTVYLEMEEEEEFPFDCRQIALEAVEAVLDYEGCPYEAEVSVTITSAEEIRKMNREYRGIDAATDVLSFPMTEYPHAGDFAFLKQEQADCFHPDSGELLLGDIVLSAPHIRRQAEEYGHSLLREYAFLIVHSTLHLIGYDHEKAEDAALMEAKQRRILDGLGIRRD